MSIQRVRLKTHLYQNVHSQQQGQKVLVVAGLSPARKWDREVTELPVPALKEFRVSLEQATINRWEYVGCTRPDGDTGPSQDTSESM